MFWCLLPQEKKRRREENLKRRLENERKAEIVQVVSPPLQLLSLSLSLGDTGRFPAKLGTAGSVSPVFSQAGERQN